MWVKTLSLFHFRNLQQEEVELQPGVNLFYGKNAQGKTNLLESIYLCATGRSQRTRLDSQLIEFRQKEAHIRLILQRENRADRIDFHLRREGRKGVAVNGIPLRKMGDLFGILHVVIFSPEDLQLIKNGPGERRRFLDMEICQLSRVYCYDLQQYYRILKQRNFLLKKMKKNQIAKEQLFVWDDQLLSYAKRIIHARKDFTMTIHALAAEKHALLTNGKERLEIHYRPNVLPEEMKDRLNAALERDLIMGTTSIGPHKDDLLFSIQGNDVKIYGSQGQQRTAALSAKLAELDFIREKTGELPVLLLDDVFSELDETRQKFLLQHMEQNQTILTCTGIENSLKQILSKGSVFFVEEGTIRKSK